MCLIIVKPEGTTVPKWIIESAQEYNSDGFGLMWRGNFEKFLSIKPAKIKAKVDALTDEKCALHFRYATHGARNQKNAHPFKLANGYLLMHNGVLSKYGKSATVGDSDTVNFIRESVDPLVTSGADAAKLRDHLEDHGAGSRFAVMNESGDIMRAGKWHDYEGLTFSNLSMWDYPQYRFAGYGAQYDSEYGNPDYSDELDMSNQAIGEIVREYLFDYSDRINWDYHAISASDLALYDALICGDCYEDTFLELASAETCLNLYRDLLRDNALPRSVSAW